MIDSIFKLIAFLFSKIFKGIRWCLWKLFLFLGKVGKIINEAAKEYIEKKSTLQSIRGKYRDEL